MIKRKKARTTSAAQTKPITARCLQDLFREFWPDGQLRHPINNSHCYPNNLACLRLSNTINNLIMTRKLITMRAGRKKKSELIRSTESFLKHLSKFRQRQEEVLSASAVHDMDEKIIHYDQGLIDKCEQTQQTQEIVEKFLYTHRAGSRATTPSHIIADAVKEAWYTVGTNQEVDLRFRQDSAPLVEFLSAVFSRVGVPRSASTISDELRGHSERRRRRRLSDRLANL
jgi:hypothetical protein